MNDDVLFFQSPRDGHPMMLAIRPYRGGWRVVVEACDCSDDESCTALECTAILDAREMTRDLVDAGRADDVDVRSGGFARALERAARWLAREWRIADLAAEVDPRCMGRGRDCAGVR